MIAGGNCELPNRYTDSQIIQFARVEFARVASAPNGEWTLRPAMFRP